MAGRILAFLLLMIGSAASLYFDYGATKIILSHGVDYQLDSWNFFYLLFTAPFSVFLYLAASILLIWELKNNEKYRQTLLMPLYILSFKTFFFLFFSPGLKDLKMFNYAWLRDYALNISLFLFSGFCLLFHIIKRAEFPIAPLKYSRKTGLL